MPAPTLPARKAAGRRTPAPPSKGNLPIANASEVVLEDGTRIPVKIPPGMPPQQAEALLAYMQANPEVAKAANKQALQMLKSPGLAQHFLNMQANAVATSPEAIESYTFLKDDPDLKQVFEDVQANGPIALQKYYDDEELMVKISAKMREMQLKKAQEAGVQPKAPATPVNLFDAAKQGDLELAAQFIAEGADVNAKNDKNVTALGIAVGFNKKEMVEFLIEKGADVMLVDGKQNTVLHYAAGYGRQQIAEILVAAGASLDALNDQKQTPLDVAKQNKESGLVEYLKAAWKKASKKA